MTDWNIEDTQVLLYISNKSGNYDEIEKLALNALMAYQKNPTSSTENVIVYLLQNSGRISSLLLNRIIEDLDMDESYDETKVHSLNVNLALLEKCGKLQNPPRKLLDSLWKILGSTEDSACADTVSHIIALVLPYFESSPLGSGIWWAAVVSSIQKSAEKRHVMAALRAWLSCTFHNHTAKDVNQVITDDGSLYFKLLEPHVAEASKFALQILESTFSKLEGPVKNEFIEFDPTNKAACEAWRRYTSLVKVLGIETSVHQTMGSLADFAALLNENSPITPRWIISLINVGLCVSNTEGIRVLTMEMIMSLKKSQMKALTMFPTFVSQVVFPRILQTPNFVVIYDQCIHSDHFERFCHNLLTAYVDHSLSSLHQFLNGLTLYFMEHAHCFEAPRALFAQAMYDTLPEKSIPLELLSKMLVAAEATNVTYNSKAMADLYLDLVRKVVTKVGGNTSNTSGRVHTEEELKIEQALNELKIDGALSRETFYFLKSNKIGFLSNSNKSFSEVEALTNVTPTTLNECIILLQASWLDDMHYISANKVAEMLERELINPTAMSAKQRERLSDSVELAFDFVESVNFELCEIAFSAFSAVPTRLSALRAFRRSNPEGIPLEDIEILWTHLKDATLRFIDRELHLEFIDLITTPNAISEPPKDICIELVHMSLRRRNLLTPLAVGLYRYANESSPSHAWVHVVMARIFSFMKSQEYTVRYEEMIANRYGIYEEKWGRPESHARALAARYLKVMRETSCGDAVIKDTLERASFTTQITGSLDNPEAHLRVLYLQILIIVQGYSSHELAMDLNSVVTASLEREANPPVRMHSEWLIGLLAYTHLDKASNSFEDFILKKVNELDGSAGTPPRVLSSLIRICLLLYYMQYTKHPVESKAIGESLVEHLLPLATSNKAVLRHRSISALYIISEKNMAPEHLKSIVETCAKINTAAVVASTHQNESYLWDLTDTRLGPVCGGVCSAVFDRYMPQTLLYSDYKDTEVLVEQAGCKNMNDIIGPCWSLDNIVSKVRSALPMPELIEQREKVVAEAIKQSLNAEFSNSMQTKSGNFDVEYHARRTELIVVATLCDKPVNLGAICRLSDALGAKAMTIKDSAVLGDQHFKSTALTAEKWIPIEEVSEHDLGQYLLSKKSEGYSLIGIEQTDTSKVLRPSLQFPKKTVLMMGHEREGIPADLLALLDSCVVIEQLGYVRSMNIQTATAVVVHSYNQQHELGVPKLDYYP